MVLTFLQDQARNDNVTVGTSSTRIAEARQGSGSGQKRRVIVVRNISTAGQTVTVSLGLSQASANNGIVLKQNESFTDSSEAGYDCFQGTINAISDAAGATLAIMER